MEDRTFELLEKMYSELIDFKKDMTEFKKDMTGFKDNMGSFKEQTSRNFQRIEAKLDGEIAPKIEALFDGYKSNSEKIEEVHDKIDNLQHDINSLAIKVANNDNRIIEIKRDLRSAR